MCGIAGFADFNSGIRPFWGAAESMRQTLLRRGPDQNGVYISDNVALAHGRLSVVDLKHGKQPMCAASYTMVYNGELYNTEDLRRELLCLGHTFEGSCDTEVLLKAYIEWGKGALLRLNGIFAFAVYDAARGELFLARDRAGVKPLFYALRGGILIFGSELKALLAHPLVKPEVTAEGLRTLMLLGPARPGGSGIFKDVFDLLPGECATFNATGLKKELYFSLEAKKHGDSFEETKERIRFLVTDAIKRQTVSDVPLVSFLSGGLDSSLISAISGVRDTYSVEYENNERFFKADKFQPDSDDAYIKIMSDYLSTTHHRVVLTTDELYDALFEAVDARDLPGMADVDSSLLLFCKEVKKDATVALSGECADELFGGYPWYRDKTVREIDGFPWSQSTSLRASLLREEFSRGAVRFVGERYGTSLADTPHERGESALEFRMKEMYKLNLDWFMQTLLDRKDRMSMWNSLEVRVPFADHRLIEYLYNVPWEMKDYKGREKGLLREAMEGVLPREVLWRKKSPYPKTHNPDYLALVTRHLNEVIADKNAPLWQVLDRQAVIVFTNSKNPNPAPFYGQLMTTPQTIAYLLQFNYWLEKYKVVIVP